MTVFEMRQALGLSQKAFGELYEIPLRTVENWENGYRVPPEYVLRLLERCVLEDIKNQKKD